MSCEKGNRYIDRALDVPNARSTAARLSKQRGSHQPSRTERRDCYNSRKHRVATKDAICCGARVRWGTKRTCEPHRRMAAFGRIADELVAAPKFANDLQRI